MLNLPPKLKENPEVQDLLCLEGSRWAPSAITCRSRSMIFLLCKSCQVLKNIAVIIIIIDLSENISPPLCKIPMSDNDRNH